MQWKLINNFGQSTRQCRQMVNVEHVVDLAVTWDKPWPRVWEIAGQRQIKVTLLKSLVIHIRNIFMIYRKSFNTFVPSKMKNWTPMGNRLHVKNVSRAGASRIAIFIASKQYDGGGKFCDAIAWKMLILKHIMCYFYLVEVERLLISVSYH